MPSLQIDSQTTLVVRPIEPSDREALAAGFDKLSPESRMRRFLGPKPKLSDRELTYLAEIDHVAHEALLALDERGDIIAVARYATWPAAPPGTAELAVVVLDAWQGRGIGSALSAMVVERARKNGIAVMTASTFWSNGPARSLISRLGFRAAGSDGAVVSYRLELAAKAVAAA